MDQIQENFNFPITWGSTKYINAYSFFINSMLVLYDFRPSFLIQYVDFPNPDDYNRIVINCIDIVPTFLNLPEPLLNETDEVKQRYINDNTLVGVEHPQGMLITKSKSLNNSFFKLLLLNSVDDDEIFGNILGYPCAGDTEITGVKVPMHIVMSNNQNQEIFSNICLISNIHKFIEKFNEINDFVSRINPKLRLKLLG